MMNSNKLLHVVMERLEQDDVYYNPGDKAKDSGTKYEDDIKATHESLKAQLNDLRSKAEQGHLNAYSVQLRTLDGRLAAIGQKLNLLDNKVEDINSNMGDFKAKDVFRVKNRNRKNRITRDEGRLAKKTSEVNQEALELQAIEKSLDYIDNELYCKHGIVSEKRAKIIYDEMLKKGNADPAAILTSELKKGIADKSMGASNKGMLNNINGTLNTYRDKTADLISEHTNATPEQAHNIATIMKRVLIGYAVKKRWTDVDGVVNKGLAIAGAYALWAAAFGEGSAPDVIDGRLNKGGMSIPGFNGKNTDQYTQNINQFGLSGNDYLTFRAGKTVSDGFINNMASNVKGDAGAKNSFLKKYISGDTGAFQCNARQLVEDSGMEPHNDAKSEAFMAQFESNDHDPSKQEEVIKFIAYLQTRLKSGEEALINSEITKYLDHIGVTAGDLSIEGIRKKEADKKGAIAKEEKDKKDKEIASINASIPTGRKIVSGKEAEALAIINKNKASRASMSDSAKIKLLSDAGVIEAIETTDADVEAKLTELNNAGAFNAKNRSEEDKKDFTRTRLETKKNMVQFGGKPELSVLDGKLYLHAFNCSIELNVENPNALFIRTPSGGDVTNNDFSPVLSDKLKTSAKLFYIAYATSGIITTLRNANFTSKDPEPFEVGGITNVITMKNNAAGFVNYMQSSFGLQSRQRMVALADFNADANEPHTFCSFLNHIGTGKVKNTYEDVETHRAITVYQTIREAGADIPLVFSRKDNIKDRSIDKAKPVQPDKKSIRTPTVLLKSAILSPLEASGDILKTGTMELIDGTGAVAISLATQGEGLILKFVDIGGTVITKTFNQAVKPVIIGMVGLLGNSEIHKSIKSLISAMLDWSDEAITKGLTIIQANRGKLDSILGGLPSKVLATGGDMLDGIKSITKVLSNKAPELLTEFTKVIGSAADAIKGLASSASTGNLGVNDAMSLLILAWVGKLLK